MKLAVASILCLALLGCGAAPEAMPPDQLTYRPSFALWSDLSAATDTRQIMLLEAELASRGETQSISGDQYLGKRTSRTVGVKSYSRSSPTTDIRNCSDFRNGAEAQRLFLASGGPTRDPHGLDRDGDGNACEWGKTLKSSAASYRKTRAASIASTSRASARSSGRCYVGPRGGTYTITASGRKNYGGC